ncbi:protein shisa-5-like [Onychostoma macrolepis]|uniref:Shisa N-terminal domain-containing protein n=1 Tax=Onychostoma macrolepis TaxID=369639 RepID=A0A7J6BR62_9TELE|nr:protein shisa-5-like [Onychostoma macrolepis]KAF4097510.1 hypothetical protein G5714_021518 [Onychostoma macrolepis]
MASNFPVFLLLSAALFTTVVGFESCHSVVCDFWSYEFCCGTCDENYCCSDPQKILTIEDCLFKGLKFSPKFSPQNDAVPIVIGVSTLGAIIIIVLFLICWICPCCYLYKKFRNPGPVTTTTTVVTRQYLPQPSAVIQGGQYLSYQALPNTLPCGGQPMPTGPPPSYQEAVGPGNPVPIQVVYDGGQATYPLQSSLPTDCTSPQPANSPAYTGCTSSVVNTSD